MSDEDKKLLRLVRNFRSGILDGKSSHKMCMKVCAPLQGYLSFFLGLETEMVEGDFKHTNHVWLKMNDGRIIDPTADQFSTPSRPMPKVFIGPKPAWYPGDEVIITND